MAVDILQQFLARRLLNVGADDSRLTLIRQATADLAQQLEATPRKAVCFALAAMDRDVTAEHPAMVAAGEALEACWNTYQGAFDDVPVSLFRAMATDALHQASEKALPIAASLAYLARNLLPHTDLGAEGPIWTELVGAAEERLEPAAWQAWGRGAFTAPTPQIKGPTLEIGIEKAKLDANILVAALGAATGPQAQDGTSYPGTPNPHWPNAGQPWTYDFSSRAAKAIAAAVDQIAVKVTLVDKGTLKGVAEDLGAFATSVAHEVQLAAAGDQRRTRLLWWKEALYSPSAGASYRDLPIPVVAAFMACDLFDETIPAYHPRSVEHFLRETVLTVADPSLPPMKAAEWVAAIRAAPQADCLKHRATELQIGAAEGGLLVSALVAGAPPTPWVGEIELSAPNLAVWLLRELQVLQATRSAA